MGFVYTVKFHLCLCPGLCVSIGCLYDLSTMDLFKFLHLESIYILFEYFQDIVYICLIPNHVHIQFECPIILFMFNLGSISNKTMSSHCNMFVRHDIVR